jgi:acyl-CoA oxidase
VIETDEKGTPDYWIEKGAIGLNGVIGCFGMTGTFAFCSTFPSTYSTTLSPNKHYANPSIFTSRRSVELAHGSNVAGLETTATLDERTDEFIVHTPHLGATKWWIGGEPRFFFSAARLVSYNNVMRQRF